MPQFFTAADGTQIAYADEGAGLPLLCLAGLTRDMADFEYLMPYLPPLRLIRMDYRGRGRSGHSGGATYTPLIEAQDALALLDHLGVQAAAILGTSRGGIIGMLLGATARTRVLGLCLNDIGPAIEQAGLARILRYLGRNPAAKTHAEMADILANGAVGFAGVPHSRWLSQARLHYHESNDGLHITYDPALRSGFEAAFSAPPVDLWPLFDACAGLPLALLRGENSDLLSEETAAEMRVRRPDMLFATVKDRAHIPFLDEPESIALIRSFLARLG